MEMDHLVPSSSAASKATDESVGNKASDTNDHQSIQSYEAVRLVGKRLYIDGFIYSQSLARGDRTYWSCVRYNKTNLSVRCRARAITFNSFNPPSSNVLMVYVGPTQSRHNHCPSIAELESAENSITFEHQTSSCDLSDAAMLNPKLEAPVASNPVENSRPKRVKNLMWSEKVSSAASIKAEQPIQENENDKATTEGNSTVAEIIGKRLYINGFTYEKNCGSGTKVFWRCKKCRKNHGGCPGRATTSDPSLGNRLLVYKGPDESPHNHLPCPMDMREAERKAKLEPREAKPESMANFQPMNEPRTGTIRVSNSSVLPVKVGKVSEPKPYPVNQVKKRKKAHETGLKRDNNLRLIGRRLFLDGYIYYPQIYQSNGTINWRCSRYRDCPSRSTTTNPSMGEKLILLSGGLVAGHNHPPNPVDVERAEIFAKMGRRRGRRRLHPTNLPVEDLECENTQPLCQTKSAPSTTPVQVKNRAANPSSSRGIQNRDSVRLVGKRLIANGFVYNRNGCNGPKRLSWVCKRYRKTRDNPNTCPASAITSNPNLGDLVVYDNPSLYKHNHPPSLQEVEEAEMQAAIGEQKFEPKMNDTEESSMRLKTETRTLNEFFSTPAQSLRSRRSSISTQPAQMKSEPFVPEKYPDSKAKSKKLLLKNPQVYRDFLVNFSKNPSFERKVVLEALGSNYRKELPRLRAYIFILENRGKIERDLAALRSNPNAEISALSDIEACDVDDSHTPENSYSLESQNSELNAAIVSPDLATYVNVLQDRIPLREQSDACMIPLVTDPPDPLTIFTHSIVKQEWIVSDDEAPPIEENKVEISQQYPIVTEGSVRSLASDTNQSNLVPTHCAEEEQSETVSPSSDGPVDLYNGNNIDGSKNEEECRVTNLTMCDGNLKQEDCQSGDTTQATRDDHILKSQENQTAVETSLELLKNPFYKKSPSRGSALPSRSRATVSKFTHGQMQESRLSHQENHQVLEKQAQKRPNENSLQKQGAYTHTSQKCRGQLEPMDPLEILVLPHKRTKMSPQQRIRVETRKESSNGDTEGADLNNPAKDDEVALNSRSWTTMNYPHQTEIRPRSPYRRCTSADADSDDSDSMSEICPSLQDLARIESEFRNFTREYRMSQARVECLSKERQFIRAKFESYKIMDEDLSKDLQLAEAESHEILRHWEFTQEELVEAEARYVQHACQRNPVLQNLVSYRDSVGSETSDVSQPDPAASASTSSS